MKRKNIIIWIVCLVIADQGVKLIVANFFIDTRFDIIESILGFRPVFNDQYSYLNALLKLNIGLLPHTVFLILIQFIVLLLYIYLRAAQHSVKLLDISFTFGQSALICVFCGFYFWKAGILDFIYLRLWTVDFKDIYLNCFAILFLLNYHKNKAELKNSKIKMKDCLSNSWMEFRQFFKIMSLKND